MPLCFLLLCFLKWLFHFFFQCEVCMPFEVRNRPLWLFNLTHQGGSCRGFYLFYSPATRSTQHLCFWISKFWSSLLSGKCFNYWVVSLECSPSPSSSPSLSSSVCVAHSASDPLTLSALNYRLNCLVVLPPSNPITPSVYKATPACSQVPFHSLHEAC